MADGNKQRIRIRLKAYDHEIIDQSTKKIVETVAAHPGQGAWPGAAPHREEPLHGDPQSPHKYKDSREHFEMRVHKRLLDIVEHTPKTVDSSATHRAAGRRRHRNQNTNKLTLCVVGSDRERSGRVYARITQAEPSGSAASRPVAVDATELVERFVGRYTNPATARQSRLELTALFAYAGISHPRALTDAAINHWVVKVRANNSRRGRLARVCTFLRWCVRQGEGDPGLLEELTSRDNPLRATPPLYGKLQGKYPARWLTHAEAYTELLGACDDSDVGRRDELVLRLGLAGMRVSEIIRLRTGNLQLGHEPTIAWIGKKDRPHRIAVGPALFRLLADYQSRYEAGLGRALESSDSVLCRQKPGGGVGLISWGRPFKQPCSIQALVAARASDAAWGT